MRRLLGFPGVGLQVNTVEQRAPWHGSAMMMAVGSNCFAKRCHGQGAETLGRNVPGFANAHSF